MVASVDAAARPTAPPGSGAVAFDGSAAAFVPAGTIHLAKGLKFRAVALAACDDEVIPLQARIERVGDDANLEEVYGTERHLLYIACTRGATDYW